MTYKKTLTYIGVILLILLCRYPLPEITDFLKVVLLILNDFVRLMNPESLLL